MARFSGRAVRRMILLLLLVAPIAAQAADREDSRLRPGCGGPFQLCGYVDKRTRAQLIPERFEVAQKFSQGLAAVRIDGRYGFIDPAGKIVIAPRFQAAGAFVSGYAEVRLNNASGIIDRSGRLLVPAMFGRIIPFDGDSFVAVALRPDGRGPTIWSAPLDGFSDPYSRVSVAKAGLYHLRKGWLTAQALEFSRFDAPERGLIWAGKRNARGDDEWGLMRSDGTWQVPPRYSYVQALVEGRAIVSSMPDYRLPRQQGRAAIRSGAVDRDGKLVVPLKFVDLSHWRGGYGFAGERKPVGRDGMWHATRQAIVRLDGSLLGGRYFDEVEVHGDGTLPRVRLGKSWHSVSADGRLLPDQLAGRPLVECSGGLSIVQQGEFVEFRRKDGGLIGRFDRRYFQEGACRGPYYPGRDGRRFIVLEDGSLLGGKSGYDASSGFHGAHAAVQVDGKWGIIDRTGAFTVKPSFASLHPDGDGKFAVGGGDGTYWIDGRGRRVGKPARRLDEHALTCPGGLRLFQEGGFWGLRDGQGKTVIGPRFRALSCFVEGVSWTAALGARSWCAIGPDGRERHALECRETFYPVTVFDSGPPEQFSSDPYESSVRWTRAFLEYFDGNRAAPPRWGSLFENARAPTLVSPSRPGRTLRKSDFINAATIPVMAAIVLLLLAAKALWRRMKASG